MPAPTKDRSSRPICGGGSGGRRVRWCRRRRRRAAAIMLPGSTGACYFQRRGPTSETQPPGKTCCARDAWVLPCRRRRALATRRARRRHDAKMANAARAPRNRKGGWTLKSQPIMAGNSTTRRAHARHDAPHTPHQFCCGVWPLPLAANTLHGGEAVLLHSNPLSLAYMARIGGRGDAGERRPRSRHEHAKAGALQRRHSCRPASLPPR